jgi:uncharacterized protein with NAD-binding domain and iron-sulfur cluster
MGKRVAVLGGGVGGLTAAHELVERGFEVVVVDRHHIPGGKARSFPKRSGTATDGRSPLPGEHGFRFFPSFYRHLPDTLRRIPIDGQPDGVAGNLVATTRIEMARAGKPAIVAPVNFPRTGRDWQSALDGLVDFARLGIPADDFLHFVRCLLLIAASCEERRLGELEDQSWWHLMGASRRSKAFQQFLAVGLTRSLVACRATEISTRTGGTILLQLLFGMATPGVRVDRVLDGPTNEVWIDPWVAYLKGRGVHHDPRVEVTGIDCLGNRIAGVTLFDHARRGARRLEADYYVAALPVEVMQPLVDPRIAAADPTLANLAALKTSWMNGVQLYLRTDVPLLPGHAVYLDSPWSLTSVSQQQFWRKDIDRDFGDGRVHGILSIDVSNWDEPGILYRLPARHCTREQIIEEIIAQLEEHLNLPGKPPVLVRANILDWNIDRDIRSHACGGEDGAHTVDCVNREPLLINTAGSWQYRPDAVSRIENLFLASDYVRTYTQLACMEGANEAARRAVNGILEESDSPATPCEVWPLEEPAIFAPLRTLDRLAYAVGAPNPIDRPLELLLETGIAWPARLAGSLPGPALFAPLLASLRALLGRTVRV